MLRPGESERQVCLLSLFDGLGTARIAVDEMLRMAGKPRALALAWAAEIDETLGAAVEAHWRRRRALAGGPEQLWAVRDVWGLV